MHQSDDDSAEVEEDTAISNAKDVSVSKENLRKLQRESERLLRERRCMIRPAPVQRRSFSDLIQKISARTANLDKIKLEDSKAVESVKTSKPFESMTHAFAQTAFAQARNPLTNLSDSCETATTPPIAPTDEDQSGNSNPVGMDEDDEDEDLIIIGVDEPKPKINPQSVPAPLPSLAEPKNAVVQPVPPKQQRVVAPLSPPANNSMKLRKGLLDTMRKSAQLRSEHLSRALTSKAALPTTALSASAAESTGSLSFLPSESFVGPKSGYKFQMGTLGLGYYPDQSAAATLLVSANVLPPPLEDAPEPGQVPAERGQGEEDGESQPFGLEAGEELVLEFDEEQGDSMAVCGDNDEAEPAPERPPIRRTYGRKGRDLAADRGPEPARPDSAVLEGRATIGNDEGHAASGIDRRTEGAGDEGDEDVNADADDEDEAQLFCFLPKLHSQVLNSLIHCNAGRWGERRRRGIQREGGGIECRRRV